MKNLKAAPAAKIAAVCFVVVSVIAFGMSMAAMLTLDNEGFYQMEKEEMLERGFDRVCNQYSVVAMAAYKEDFGEKTLSDTNFCYGVVRADDLADVDLAKPSSYIAGNFKQKSYSEYIKQPEGLHVFSCSIGEDTAFQVGTGLFGTYSVYDLMQDAYQAKEYPMDGYYYDWFQDQFYIRSEKKLFPVFAATVYTADGEEIEANTMELEAYLLRTGSDEMGVASFQWDKSVAAVMFEDGIVVSLNEVSIVDSVELAKIGSVCGDTLERADRSMIYVLEPCEPEKVSYYVLSCVQTPLEGAGSLGQSDLFVQMKRVIDFAYRIRYLMIVIFIVSMLVFLASFSFLMCAAGHRKGETKIVPGLAGKIPLDLYLACVGTGEVVVIEIVVSYLSQFRNASYADSSFNVTGFVFAAMGLVGGILLAVNFCMSFAVNVKLGRWWRNTLVYWICKKCMHMAGTSFRFTAVIFTGLYQSMTLLWKAWLVLGVAALMEYLAISIISYRLEGGLFGLWLLEKILVYPIIILILMQADRLQKGAQRIADGELDYRIQTGHMFWEMKKHGEYLNDIGTGMNRAVNERMKSERFKTELITNVSHDIKTPLTSIINYVDLLRKEMRKEQPAETAVQDYLEVLHRQSARLKKLIEDLMEASKASTGSMGVTMEKCDTGVMIVQTIGEFEEKLMENQIELQIKKPEETISIEADSRHLWRVFDNLMNNICKYAQPMTRAYINLEQDAGRAYIIFRNISKYQLNISSEELMERFVRGDSSRNTEGSGLGISIAKSLTELMNGTFELVVDGDLFKVTVSFPLYEQQDLDKTKPKPDQDIDSIYADDGFAVGEPAASASGAGTVAKVISGIQKAGIYTIRFASRLLDLVGVLFRIAGSLLHHARQAAGQAIADQKEPQKTAGTKTEIDADIDKAIMESRKQD
ncbi:MAG: HAMP domain-containing histidine kinase [Eubacterium sp.]|nr:HAMP domain-containing histidine kinase [Eubacterium sp.]